MNIQENRLNTPFLHKLNLMLTDTLYSHIITWDTTGTMIDILDEKKIQAEILPKLFRHSKLESFIRQLNLYGFKKLKKSGCHRFGHPDLIKRNSLFSIKSQRKFKNLPKKTQLMQKAQNQEPNKQEKIGSLKQGSQRNQNVQNKTIQTQNSVEHKAIISSPGPTNLSRFYQSPYNMNNFNFIQPTYYASLMNNPNNYGIQGSFIPNLNNIYFYN